MTKGHMPAHTAISTEQVRTAYRTEGASRAFRIAGYQGGLLERGSMCKEIFKVVKVRQQGEAFSTGTVCKT